MGKRKQGIKRIGSMKGFIDGLRLFTAACCLATTCPAGEAPDTLLQLAPVSGIETVRVHGNDRGTVHCSKGICLFLLRLAPGSQTVTIHFYYAADRPFAKIEGIHVLDNKTGNSIDSDALQARGRLTMDKGVVRLRNHQQGVDWLVRVIDYYR